jgi:GT2 family glycosyltransferase
MHNNLLIEREVTSTPRTGFTPTRIMEVELSHPLSDLCHATDITNQPYQKALCLVRLHSCPLKVVELTLEDGQLGPQQLAEQIWQEAQEQINRHLQEDGLETIVRLDKCGVSGGEVLPRCRLERERLREKLPFASVVVATRNRPKLLQRCIDTLLQMDYPQYEIIVVDNAPDSPATEEIIRERYREMPQVQYMREEQPGLAKARNRGCQIAQGEIIAITDDDVNVDKYWLLELVRDFQVSELVVCVTGLVLPMEMETIEQHWFGQYGGYGKGFERRIFDKKEHHPQVPLFPYTAGKLGTGANLAVRADFFKKIGGFDPALGAGTAAKGGEDLALFFQIMHRGYTLVYEPRALLYHPDCRDYQGLCQQMYSYGAGLTAYLTRTLLNHPQLIFDLITKIPYSIYFIFNKHSPKNSKKSINYPKELTRLELKGMCYGPPGYLLSVWSQRGLGKLLPGGISSNKYKGILER